MRKMKNSVIEWIGEIPEDWEVKAIRYLIKEHFSGAWGENEKENLNDRICMRIADFDYDKLQFKNLSEENLTKRNYESSEILHKTLREGDLLIEKSGGGEKTPVGRTVVYRLKHKALFANFMDCIRLKNSCDVEFAKYSFFALYKRGVTNLYFNQTTGIQNLNMSKYFREVKIPLPPTATQQRIADFLDAKCAKIDSLKSDIQKQIETLEQYKKSVITEAVTKGLNPNTKMKNNGSKWLPSFPAHWEMKKLKYNLSAHEVKGYAEKEVLSLYRELGIVPKNSRDDNHNVTSEDTSKYKYVKVGDFVINKMKAWQGSVAVSDYEGIVSPAYYIYEFTNDSYDKKYFHHLMRNKILADEFRRISGGIREGQWDLDREQFENMYLPVPPKAEQIEIAKFIESKYGNIEKSIDLKKQQLEKLEEYKKSLIFEYVTGKKEV